MLLANLATSLAVAAAVDNGNPTSHEAFQAAQRRAHENRRVAILE
jgi:hypothetical protein